MRILIYNVNWRGDVLFSAPAIRAIKQLYPDAYLTCLVTPRCREVLKGNPDINELMCFDERHDRALHLKWNLIRDIKSQSFDMVFLFHRSFTRALIVTLARIPKRVGYVTKGRGFLLTHPVSSPKQLIHKVDYFLGLARSMGAKETNRNYRFHITHEDEERADKILKDYKIQETDSLIILNPGGNWLPKRWAPDRFAQLADRLQAQWPALRIVLTGAPKDQALGEEILRQSSASLVSLCGKTSLGELGAIMRQASLVVANDSGPLHISIGVGTPTLALFGPTSVEWTGPIGEHAILIQSGDRMEDISVDQVFQKAQGVLKH